MNEDEIDVTDEIEDEVESSEDEYQPSQVERMIDAIAAGEFNQANDIFGNAISDKLDTALEAEKVAVAGRIFNGDTEESFDDDDLDTFESEEDEIETEIDDSEES